MKRAILLALATPVILAAQQLPNLPRSVTGAGLNDSALTLVSDSARRTRAASVAQVRKALSLKPFDSLSTTRINLTSATAIGAATWGSQQIFATGQRVDSATGAARASALVGSPAITVSSCTGCGGGATVSDTVRTVTFDSVRAVRMRADTIRANAGASKRLVLQTTTSGSALTTAVRFNEVQQSLFADGTAARPSVALANDTTLGMYRNSPLVLGFATQGADRFNLSSVQATFSVPIVPVAGTAATPGIVTGGSSNSGIFGNGDTVFVSNSGVRGFGVRGGASSTIFGGTGNMTIQAGIGTARTLALQSTSSTGVAKTCLTVNSDVASADLGRVIVSSSCGTAASTLQIPRGRVGAGGIVFADSGTGSDLVQMYAPGTSSDTLAFSSSGGVRFFSIGGTGNSQITGGAGNMTITPGTGTTRTMTLQTITSSGAIKNTLVLGADSTATFLGQPIMTNLPAEGSTKNAVCWDGTTHAVTQNAAATCTVSSRRFKTNIKSLTCSDANRMVAGLRPVSYEEKVGGSRRLGIIAEEADSIDSRLASRDAKGLITSTNYEEVFTALLRVEQCSGKH